MQLQKQFVLRKKRNSSRTLKYDQYIKYKQKEKEPTTIKGVPQANLKKNHSLGISLDVHKHQKQIPINKEEKFRLHLVSLTKKPIKNLETKQSDDIISINNQLSPYRKNKVSHEKIQEQKQIKQTIHQNQIQLLKLDSRKNRGIILPSIQKFYKIQAQGKTKAGCNGKTLKINQDRFHIDTNLQNNVNYFLICDGHGANGHYVSQFIKQILFKNLITSLKKSHSQISLLQTFKDSFKKTNQSLLTSDINTQLSGSTVIAVFLVNHSLYCLNVGDSRAIIISQSKSKWKVKPLSFDHKPQRQDEKKRIIKQGGVIRRQKDQTGREVGPQRVWKKDLLLPGLAMTRSFGDKAGMKAGTCGEPELIYHQINDEDKFIVLASDGVWEYLDNEAVMNIIIPFYQSQKISEATDKIIQVASKQWEKNCFSRDDITIVIVVLKHLKN